MLARLRVLDGDALAFAHGHILRVLTARWLEMEPAAGPGSARRRLELSMLGYERETHVIQRWNAELADRDRGPSAGHDRR